MFRAEIKMDDYSELFRSLVMEEKVLRVWALILGVMEDLTWMKVGVILGFLMALNVWLQRNSKAPVTWPLVGMLPSLILNLQRLYDWGVDMLRDSGGTHVFKGPWRSNLDAIVSCDPEIIEYVLKINFSNFPKGQDFYEEFHDLLGDGIFNADFERWREQRKMSSLHFNSRSFRQFMAEAVSQTVEKRLIPVLADAAEKNLTLDLQDVFLRYTFDNTCSVVFGKNLGCLAVDMPQIPFAKAFDECVETTFYRQITPRLFWKFMRFLKLGKERRMLDALKILKGFVDDLIDFKKKEIIISRGGTRDLLACFMLQFEPEELSGSHQFLRDMVLNFVIAGRDTSGVALAWFFWLLSRHPRVEEKVFQELLAILNQRSSSQKMEPFTAKELQDCIYLHATLTETLRLYPSVPNDHKGVLHRDVLPDGTCIEPGMKFVYNIYALGRMQSVWGPDSLEFKPERWIDVSGDGKLRMKKESMYKFLAFNAGPRTCLGKDMAYLQMKAAAAGILRRFHVRVVENQVVKPKLSLILAMKNGLLVTLQERPSLVHESHP